MGWSSTVATNLGTFENQARKDTIKYKNVNERSSVKIRTMRGADDFKRSLGKTDILNMPSADN